MDTLSEVKQTPVPNNKPTGSNDVTPLRGDKQLPEADADQAAPVAVPPLPEDGATTSSKHRLTDQCTFYVKRKRRNCNAPTVGGRDYCVEHSYLLGVSL